VRTSLRAEERSHVKAVRLQARSNRALHRFAFDALSQQDIRICKLRQAAECPIWVAGSTDRRNTFGELLGWGLIEQGLSRACGLQGR
jgi:hypothetical protein